MIKYFKKIFNRKRIMKNSVESLLFLIAALLGGTLSLVISKMNLPLYDLLLFALILLIFGILLIVFWDWYEKPNRIENNVNVLNIKSNTDDIKSDVEEIKRIIRNKLT